MRNRYALTVVTEPTNEPVTAADVKAHLRIDATDDDTYLATLITAARKYVEGVINRTLTNTVYDLTMDGWPDGDIVDLPRPPLVSVTSVTYYDTADASAVFASTNYFVDTKSEPGRLVLGDSKTWPSTTLRPANGVVIRFTGGYGTADTNVPQNLRLMLKVLIADLYENREDNVTATVVARVGNLDRLLWSDRVVQFA